MSEITEIKAGKYRHFKGGLYTVIGVATNSENLGKVVVYQDEVSGRLWVRPASMWNDVIDGKRRFELISSEELIDGNEITITRKETHDYDNL